jgi:OOP family OmpA-OmpF porin
MKKSILVFAAILPFNCLGSNTDDSFYLGASVLNAKTEYFWDENDDNGYALKVGYAISKYFALEAGYQDLGSFTWSNKNFEGGGSFDSKAYYLSTIATYPSDKFSLHAELGYQMAQQKGDIFSIAGINPHILKIRTEFL